MASTINLSFHLISFLLIGNTWLENKSFSIEPPVVPFQRQSTIPTKSNPVIDIKPKEEKKPIAKPVQNIVTKKTEANELVFDFFRSYLMI